ncbi:cytochrome P450 [Xylaria bambusicola]|uniref:cytochrome P450 n=1 Tax=Xylaria bambusicola TaxID=326684 RepID=UPI0020087E57|nr:cytochrome P450 [Xylaria bambusicola]KAI0513192.1 cytochrome P450 [Xylaria bambusicola]
MLGTTPIPVTPDILEGLVLLCTILFSLCFITLSLAKAQSPRSPHSVPYSIPILKSTIPFAFDGFNFLHNALRQFPYASTLQISTVVGDIYLVTGPKNVNEVFRSPRLTITRSWSLVLRQCFGMKQRSVDAYLADTSGTRYKPIPGSSAKPKGRISLMTHENLNAGLLQGGLGPATDRFETLFQESLQAMDIGHDWAYMPDITEFFQNHQGSALIRTLFGEGLLTQESHFISDLWVFDEGVMNLARRIPRVFILKTARARDRLLAAVKRWQQAALTSQKNSEYTRDSVTDPSWGTKMMRERYHTLLGATGQDESSVASTNLAFIWASATTVVPSSTTMAIQIFRSQSLLTSLRGSLSRLPPTPTIKELESIPLLLSTYAETLRFGIHIHIPRTAPHHDLSVNNTIIPKDHLILINTRLAHTDEEVWDTHHGMRPLDEFHADRFIIDPNDPTSGPTRKKQPIPIEKLEHGAYFSAEGLEGAWIPYGGGQNACPGRLLAKRIMLLSTAYLINNFDIELLEEEKGLHFTSPRFGFGVSKPQGPVRFRIRRRNHTCNSECAYYVDT